MAKPKFTSEDDALLAELGIEVEVKKSKARTPREERVVAGFEEIERFIESNSRLPQHGEDKDIFERLYAVRLDAIRNSSECISILKDLDKNGILADSNSNRKIPDGELDDDVLLEELGISKSGENDITKLTHVRTRAEIKAAEEVARQTLCNDFEKFKPLFISVQEELKNGIRKSREFKNDVSINLGDFFILSGKITYVAEVGEEITAPNGEADARLRVIFDNGTESNLLRRSLQRALFKDSFGNKGKRISSAEVGPLFSDEMEDSDSASGTIYVLRSKSDHPMIKEHGNVIHKIGVTGGDIKTRIAAAKDDPTFLMADVEVIATYELSNINRTKLEKLIHKFFEPAKLNIEIKDRFGKPIIPREWFLVPLFIIDEAVEKIKHGEILNCQYDVNNQKILVK